MVSPKALLVCLVFGLCFVVISSELMSARQLADKTNSVEHTTSTKEEKTEVNGVNPDSYYEGFGGYRRGYGGYRRRGYGGYYPPETKTQESTSTEDPDWIPPIKWPWPKPRFPPGGNE